MILLAGKNCMIMYNTKTTVPFFYVTIMKNSNGLWYYLPLYFISVLYRLSNHIDRGGG